MHRRTESDLSLRTALRELPRLDPPEAVWQRIDAELDRQPVKDAGAARARVLKPALAASIAAFAAILTLVVDRPVPIGDAPPPRLLETGHEADAPDISALVAESEMLERLLFALPRHEGVVRVGAAGTIAGLEDHIAWIDAELSAGEALGADPIYRQTLWQERVSLMSALVDVEFAQLPEPVLLQ